MKGKFQFSILVLAFCFIFAACKEERPFFSVSQFTLQQGALEDGENVKLLYYSGHAKDADDYFAQVIVLSEKSGDTFNILMPSSLHIEHGDTSSTFGYQSFNNPVYMEIVKDTKYWTSEESVLTNIKKVTRDPRYDETALNTYPTCVGIIGKVITKSD
ncbi:MAG: hypothetical protein ACYC1Q_04595 [Bacteroidia bacterium]